MSQEGSLAGRDGYDLNWVEEPPSELVCLICLCVAKDPHQHPGDSSIECGKIFCHDCITKHQRESDRCPNCRKSLNIFKDTRSARHIRGLSVRCNYLDDGCEWTGRLGEQETHLQLCDYTFVSCSNQCKMSDSSEVRKIRAKDLAHHLAEECPRREFKCSLCSEAGEYEQMTSHNNKCPRVRVSCPNDSCSEKVLRCDIKSHLTSCAYEPVSCKYAEVGCGERPLRKDFEMHVKDAQFHLQITTDKVLDLTKKVVELTRKCSPILIKMHKFEHYKNEKRCFYSSPFYTSQSGYKMYVGVYANGYGDGKDTHVSVYAYLMKGDNDDSLTWPFTGTVTFELLNQLEDKNHHQNVATFPAEGEYGKRVLDGVRSLKGWGFGQFISHTDLDNQQNQSCQYLRDDALMFRVSVEVPDYKPWLE